MNKIEEVYSSKDYCLEEMSRIREMWGNKKTFTKKAMEAAGTSLSYMYLYCPKELMTGVETMLLELERRNLYLVFGG